jgi:hypothetical protein
MARRTWGAAAGLDRVLVLVLPTVPEWPHFAYIALAVCCLSSFHHAQRTVGAEAARRGDTIGDPTRDGDAQGYVE